MVCMTDSVALADLVVGSMEIVVRSKNGKAEMRKKSSMQRIVV